MKKLFALIGFCFLFFVKTNAEPITADSFYVVTMDSAQVVLELRNNEQLQSPNTFLQRIREKLENNKKLISAVLAFPLPFGMVGGHRIFMGTKPYVPLVYIATVGGCFGILPLVDFLTIVFTKKEDLGKFENNSRIFMWAQ